MACSRVIQCDETVTCTAIAPDGQLLAVGLWNNVQLLDARSGERRTNLDSDAAFSVAFSPASSASQPQLLAAGFSNNTVDVWDCSGNHVTELRGHSGSILCVAFSPDGRLLASASNDTTVRLWRTGDWRVPPTVLRDHAGYALGVSFSCDGRTLASCSWNGTVRLYILDRSAASITAAAAAAGPVLEVNQLLYCVAFSPVDSRLLACGGEGRFLAVARVSEDDGTIAVERKLRGHAKDVLSLAFSPCGQKLASASWDKTVRLWSVASGACLRVLRGHMDEVRGVAFFPDGKQLASGSKDNTVRIWTVNAWSDKTHHLFGASLKAAVFTLMCVRARLDEQEQEQGGPHALQLPRLPMEVWLLVFGELQLAMEVN